MTPLERIRAERLTQGLPPKVDEPAALAEVAAIILNARRAVATNDGPSNHESGQARTRKGSDGRGSERAA